ncbi:4260_t:CDS:2 [Rhizophagus irregularis]|nr:4260_t:CDS:2 [Rhizophagus irregularis]
MSNTFIINTLPALHNDTFEFYFPLPNSALYSDNNNAYNAASNSVNGTISDNIQDTEFQNSY